MGQPMREGVERRTLHRGAGKEPAWGVCCQESPQQRGKCYRNLRSIRQRGSLELQKTAFGGILRGVEGCLVFSKPVRASESGDLVKNT